MNIRTIGHNFIFGTALGLGTLGIGSDVKAESNDEYEKYREARNLRAKRENALVMASGAYAIPALVLLAAAGLNANAMQRKKKEV